MKTVSRRWESCLWMFCWLISSWLWGDEPRTFEAEGLTGVKGTQVIEVPGASGGKVLELSTSDAAVQLSVPLTQGEYALAVCGYGPSPDKDALYVEIAGHPRKRLAFGKDFAGQRVLFFVAKAGPVAISVSTDEPGVCLDRLVILEGEKPQGFEMAEFSTKLAQRDWLTRLHVSFDDAQGVNPDYARGIPYGAANNTTVEPKGKFGAALGFYNLDEPYGSIIAVHSVEQAKKCVLYYPGGGNMPTRQGTIEFWLRSRDGVNLWGDGRQHDVFHVMPTGVLPGEAPGFRIDLVKGENNTLMLDVGGNGLAVDVEGMDAREWHHIACSWGALTPPGRIWLAVDGKGITKPCAGELHPHSFLVFYLGNTFDYEKNYPLDAALDDLKVSEWTLGERTAEGLAERKTYAIDDPLAMQAEEGLRRWLGVVMEMSMRGGWSMLYQWPTRLPFNSTLVQDPTDPRVRHHEIRHAAEICQTVLAHL